MKLKTNFIFNGQTWKTFPIKVKNIFHEPDDIYLGALSDAVGI